MAILSTTTKLWLHGLAAAAITAFSTAASGVVALPTVFSFDHNGVMNMLKLTAVPTGLAVFAYLRKSPLPGTLLEPGDKATVQDPVISLSGQITGSSATLEKAPPAADAGPPKPL